MARWLASFVWPVGAAVLALASTYYLLLPLISSAVYYHHRIRATIEALARNPEVVAQYLRSAAYVYFTREQPSQEHQDFIDHYAVHAYSHDSLVYHQFGPDPRVRPLPRLLERFDWLSAESCPGCPWGDGKAQEVRKVSDPHTVYLYYYGIESIDWLLQAAREWDPLRTDRVLVLGSGDELLSDMKSDELGNATEVAGRLREHFKLIWMQGKDVEVDDVNVMPLLLYEAYLRGGVVQTAAQSIEAAGTGKKSKRVLAAFSFHFDYQNDVEMPFKAGGLRADAVRWAASEETRGELGVERRSIPQHEWWPELAKYKFLLVPPGLGVQSTKAYEALLVLTIPIVQRVRGRAIDELIAMGFPMVAVDSWDEVTAESLQRWWEELSPQLEGFRRNCFNTDAIWRLITGRSADSCWAQRGGAGEVVEGATVQQVKADADEL